MTMANENLSMEWFTAVKLTVTKWSIPDDWKHSALLTVFTQKENPMKYGPYRAIQLLQHAMKVIERALERITESSIDTVWIWIAVGTTNENFTIRHARDTWE